MCSIPGSPICARARRGGRRGSGVLSDGRAAGFRQSASPRAGTPLPGGRRPAAPGPAPSRRVGCRRAWTGASTRSRTRRPRACAPWPCAPGAPAGPGTSTPSIVNETMPALSVSSDGVVTRTPGDRAQALLEPRRRWRTRASTRSIPMACRNSAEASSPASRDSSKVPRWLKRCAPSDRSSHPPEASVGQSAAPPLRRQPEEAGALGRQHPLVGRARVEVRAEGRDVEAHHARRVGAVHHQRDPAPRHSGPPAPPRAAPCRW